MEVTNEEKVEILEDSFNRDKELEDKYLYDDIFLNNLLNSVRKKYKKDSWIAWSENHRMEYNDWAEDTSYKYCCVNISLNVLNTLKLLKCSDMLEYIDTLTEDEYQDLVDEFEERLVWFVDQLQK